MKVQDLLDERNGLIEDSRKILDKDEDLSGEDRAELDRMEGRVSELDDRIARGRKLDQAAASFERPQGQRDEAPSALEERENGGDLVRGPEVVIRALAEGKDVPATLNEYRKAIRGPVLQDQDAYRAAFFHNFVQGKDALNRDEVRALAKGTAQAGGSLVPTDFEKTLLDKAQEVNIMRELATVFTTTTGNSIEVPRVLTHGSAAWTAEAQAFTESDDTFEQIVFEAWKAATIIRVSEELLQDAAFDLEAYIRAEFARRIGRLEGTAYLVGDGTNKPKGVFPDAEIGVTGAGGQTTTVTGDDLVKLFYALKRPYRVNASWVFADASIAAVRLLKDADGQYIWAPGLVADEPDRLLGRPVYTDPDAPVMAANQKSILFGDFSHYWIRDVQGVLFQRLNELYAASGQVGFRTYHRTDGELTIPEAVKAYRNAAA